MESNEQNELTSKIVTDTESRLTAVEGMGELSGRLEGLSKKEKKLMDTDYSAVSAREEWGGGRWRRLWMG